MTERFITPDSHFEYFLHEPFGIGCGVVVRDTKQHEETLLDVAVLLGVDTNLCVFDTLYNNSHSCKVTFFFRLYLVLLKIFSFNGGSLDFFLARRIGM